jgi:phosphomannomutase
MTKSIFKAYDIRGLVEEELNPDLAYKIGFGLAKKVFNGNSPIVISHDARSHSALLVDHLVQGLNDGGCKCALIGLASTPMNYWANVHLKAAGSIQVTASHNGPQYNGFKVSGSGASPIALANGLQEVREFIDKWNETPASKSIKNETYDLLADYLDFMAQFIALGSKPLKIVVDAGNGMAGHFLAGLQSKLPDNIELVPLFWELDGTFPNHPPDPMKEENLDALKKQIIESKADFGVAFDGDADRCVFIDENAQFISSDLMVALLAENVLNNSPRTKSPILYDLRSSAILKEVIERNGGKAVPSRVGHSFMKKGLKELDADFGGELSGHYYFKECFYTDSGLMAMLKVVNILSGKQAQSLGNLIKPFRKYFATNEISFKIEDKGKAIKLIEEKYAADALEVSHLDGLSIKHADWWFNLRESNTESLLRICLESNSAELKNQKFAEIQLLLNN